MQRRWKITLAGAGMAVAAAGMRVLLVLSRRWKITLAGAGWPWLLPG
jgi:hypothetical protein